MKGIPGHLFNDIQENAVGFLVKNGRLNTRDYLSFFLTQEIQKAIF